MTRARVIIDNDFSGDPDDLFHLAHHVLSPSVEIPFVIGSHLAPGDPFDPSERQADNAAEVARGLLGLLGSDVPVIAGSNRAMTAPDSPLRSPAAEAIVAEALREDTGLPLYVAAGGGLTEVAGALLIEPAIADRLTVVWIGGPEYDESRTAPGAPAIEYNLGIDVPAARAVLDSSVALWQVPRDVYRQSLVSSAEIDARVRPHGPLGAHLAGAIDALRERAARRGLDLGETYCMGDSPLVLLTALQTSFQPDPGSSAWQFRPAPTITAEGRYGSPAPRARDIRVFTRLDTRLMFEDLFLKLELFARKEH